MKLDPGQVVERVKGEVAMSGFMVRHLLKTDG